MITVRLKQYIDYKGIKVSAFERSIGASDGMLRKAFSKGSDIKSTWLEVVSEKYHDLNVRWLITGQGEMLLNPRSLKAEIGSRHLTSIDSVKTPKVPVRRKKGIPLIPIEAMAGWGVGDVQVMNYETNEYSIPEFDELKVDFMIRVKGSSMYPKYNSGDMVACRKLSMETFFQWNKVYVLSTNPGAIIKRVNKSERNNSILCVSDNPHYTPFDLDLSEVYSLAIVVGVIRLE